MRPTAVWMARQWNRYDTFLGEFTKTEDDSSKRALCLALVRTVLRENETEKILSDILFTMSDEMTLDCRLAVGRANVSDSRAHLLLFLWSVPFRHWKQELYRLIGNHCRRSDTAPASASLRNAIGSLFRVMLTRIESAVNAVLDSAGFV